MIQWLIAVTDYLSVWQLQLKTKARLWPAQSPYKVSRAPNRNGRAIAQTLKQDVPTYSCWSEPSPNIHSTSASRGMHRFVDWMDHYDVEGLGSGHVYIPSYILRLLGGCQELDKSVGQPFALY